MRQGLDAHQAIVESTLTRIRPIMMTTGTTIFGLMPLVLNPGAGSELYRGLGMVMFGGLILGTVTTIVFIPSVMSLMFDAAGLLRRQSNFAAAAAAPATPLPSEAGSGLSTRRPLPSPYGGAFCRLVCASGHNEMNRGGRDGYDTW